MMRLNGNDRNDMSMTPKLPMQPDPPRPHRDEDVSISAAAQWTVRRMTLATMTVLAVVLGFLLIYRFYMIVFLFFVALSLTVALEPGVKWLQQRGVRKEYGVAVLFTLVAGVAGVLLWLIGPPVIEQVQQVVADLPNHYANLRAYLVESNIGLVRGVGRALPAELSLPALAATAGDQDDEGTSFTWRYLSLAVRTFFAILGVFFLTYYWTLEGDRIIRKLLLRAPSDRRDEWRQLIDEINGKIGGYFRGQVILCVIVGVSSIVAFLLLGIPNAVMLGLVMGIFEAVPVIGPTLGAIPAVLMTLATAPEKTLWVIGALVAIQVLENNLLVPRVMDETVGVNAVVSMLAIAAFGALFGIVGAVLAIPLAAILQIVLNRLLFALPVIEETTTAGAPATASVGRSRLDVLRLEARQLAQDMRKQMRGDNGDEVAEVDSDQTSDEIEAIATDLDHYLATVEAKV
jgi:predicted PurR-regulated permease PerM